ncbi:hypothetical protein [Pedobacter frigiditerrae]|uniref:hypothetical protein n=1 Tax=Pedobacter frigiditerrae TaxID=2530452 RepID=UPI0029317280|nr:hypothetical protein [Pedobacter frigiditerrae]
MKSFFTIPLGYIRVKRLKWSPSNFDLVLKLLFKTIKNPKEITHIFWFSSPLEKQA